MPNIISRLSLQTGQLTTINMQPPPGNLGGATYYKKYGAGLVRHQPCQKSLSHPTKGLSHTFRYLGAWWHVVVFLILPGGGFSSSQPTLQCKHGPATLIAPLANIYSQVVVAGLGDANDDANPPALYLLDPVKGNYTILLQQLVWAEVWRLG